MSSDLRRTITPESEIRRIATDVLEGTSIRIADVNYISTITDVAADDDITIVVGALTEFEETHEQDFDR